MSKGDQPRSSTAAPSASITSLQSEIETFKCIVDVKDKEIELLKCQLAESNRIIEKTREFMISNPPATTTQTEKQNTENQPEQELLLQSFSNASSGTLRRVLCSVQESTDVVDILHLPKRVEQLFDSEKKYDQLYKAACLYLRPGDISHSALVQMLRNQGKSTIQTNDGEILQGAVKRGNGISWTFK